MWIGSRFCRGASPKAVSRSLTRLSTEGCFPPELFELILGHLDGASLKAASLATAQLRQLARRFQWAAPRFKYKVNYLQLNEFARWRVPIQHLKLSQVDIVLLHGAGDGMVNTKLLVQALVQGFALRSLALDRVPSEQARNYGFLSEAQVMHFLIHLPVTYFDTECLRQFQLTSPLVEALTSVRTRPRLQIGLLTHAKLSLEDLARLSSRLPIPEIHVCIERTDYTLRDYIAVLADTKPKSKVVHLKDHGACTEYTPEQISWFTQAEIKIHDISLANFHMEQIANIAKYAEAMYENNPDMEVDIPYIYRPWPRASLSPDELRHLARFRITSLDTYYLAVSEENVGEFVEIFLGLAEFGALYIWARNKEFFGERELEKLAAAGVPYELYNF